MNIAEQLGVDDLDSLRMQAARHSWTRWCTADPELAVVDTLLKLPQWTRYASRAETDGVLANLAGLTAYHGDAATVLAWLLVPGANRIVVDLSDLHPDIERIVAGQLWIEVSQSHHLKPRRIAATILARTRREVAAERGVGDLAMRRDRVWAETVRVENVDDLAVPVDAHESLDDLFDQITDLMIEAMDANAIHVFDAWLLGTLANLAAQMDAPGHRGRMGLTAPAVVDRLADVVHLSPRAIRRRASAALDRWSEYLAVRDDPERFGMWRAQHTSCPVTPAEEMHLVLTENHDAHFFRVRDLPQDAWAPDVSPERRRPATG